MKDIRVEDTITLAILSTALLSEYMDPTRYVNTALGIADCIRSTPAIKPDRFKSLIRVNPTTGPNIILTTPRMAACVQETTLRRVKATPSAIKTKNIVV